MNNSINEKVEFSTFPISSSFINAIDESDDLPDGLLSLRIVANEERGMNSGR